MDQETNQNFEDNIRYYADFETTVDNLNTEQERARVWVWGLIDDLDNFKTGTTIESFFNYLDLVTFNLDVLFHNLKFDGTFILYYLLEHDFQTKDKSKNNFLKTNITSLGQYHLISYINKEGFTINFYDSFKLLPSSISTIGKNLGIEKLQIGGDVDDYDRVREIGYLPNNNELKYLKQDIRIAKLGVENLISKYVYKHTTPSISYSILLDTLNFELPKIPIELDELIRPAYLGGWTFLNPKKKGIVFKDVHYYDINSTYPYRMKFEPLPYELPKSIKKQDFQLAFDNNDKNDFYILNFYIKARLKANKFASIQTHKSLYSSADYADSIDGVYTLATPDIMLLRENYHIYKLKINYGFYSKTKVGLFEKFVDRFMGIKETTEDTFEKVLSKLILNSSYGKFGKNPTNISKIPELDKEGNLRFRYEQETETINEFFLPIAIAITGWARYSIVKTACDNYEEFIYADTDSIHSTKPIDNLQVDQKKLGYWKIDKIYPEAKYLKAKRYMFKSKKGDKFVSDFHVSGLPKNRELELLSFDEFMEGLEIQGKKSSKIIKGGTKIWDTTFKLS